MTQFWSSIGVAALASVGLAVVSYFPARRLQARRSSYVVAACWLMLAFLFFCVARVFGDVLRTYGGAPTLLTRTLCFPAQRAAWGSTCLGLAVFSLWKDRRSPPPWVNSMLTLMAGATFLLFVLAVLAPLWDVAASLG